ncbi:RecQ family ATP-dependent DNA helicase [Bacillus chungangensis]|uniref:ATP-dependent DNA helicase RecQ n=1 Tax=Bacillus chungangensis TaxID=587633 RepID=A0ABT9WNH1_9BACI|nr:ATP-dependent DNA helicase RecQ [Bacillus chungangensis]MDQ0174816.1 ATP-dependent DNA helicase RecQ [Bacillus chungangensis]
MELHSALKKYFGYDCFRTGQQDIISSVLEQQNTLAMLPTGTGKSLCYQLPGYLLDGAVVIVSPLLSLMQDQVAQMHFRGEKSVIALNSFLGYRDRKLALSMLSNYRFIFVSPEMLANEQVLEKLRTVSIALFVIDEAHCISQWGPDFRPDYLRLGAIRQQLNEPVTLALTATATRQVREDIKEVLKISVMKEWIFSIDRPNIAMAVEQCDHYHDKIDRLLSLVQKLEKPGIIYFSSKRAAEDIAVMLWQAGISSTAAYHGGMEQEQRMLIQQQFLFGQLQVICATNAFGMGINKENIRFVIHFHLPQHIEGYLQEIGRAGRDGEKALALLLYSAGDELLPQQMIETELPTDEQIEYFYRSVSRMELPLLMEKLQLTEIQFRFLQFHQSKSKMEREEIEAVKKTKAERRQHKLNKLFQMKRFISDTACRRMHILAYFDEKMTKSLPFCCDNCKINIEDYYLAIAPHSRKEERESWECILQKLLLKK